jgi:hypothetical protein
MANITLEDKFSDIMINHYNGNLKYTAERIFELNDKAEFLNYLNDTYTDKEMIIKMMISYFILTRKEVRKISRENMYLDFVNNFLTAKKFAEYYKISLEDAKEIIESKGL